MIPAARVIGFALLLTVSSLPAVAEEFPDAIHAYLQRAVEVEKRAVGIVVGIVDEQGSRVVSCGRFDNGTEQQVDGDTLFEIGSVGKTFTVLLLQDMMERGEMKLDDPVARYLPLSVKMPTRHGKEITLHHLATHTSGLPGIPDNLDSRRADNPYADYTGEKLYAFLSAYELTRDPGTQSQYSNLGMGLLGHAITLQAGMDYEALVVERICRPLQMDSTRITLTPELKARFAAGHNPFGEAVPSWDVPVLAGAGAPRSTAHDLLKYVSANLGLTPSPLTPLMGKTHDLGLAWSVTPGLQGTTIISHAGGTGGYRAFIGLDKARRRGVVVLSNSVDAIGNLGHVLLESEWPSDRRPAKTTISDRLLDSYVGQYRLKSDAAPRRFKLWPFSGREKGTTSPSKVGIRCEGDRLFAQATGSSSGPLDELLPPVTAELLPESETRFFERLSGASLTFSRRAPGKVTGLTIDYQGKAFFYEKVSDQPPQAPERRRPRVAVKLDTRLLDAVVGQYEFAPSDKSRTGGKAIVWREGDRLVGQVFAKDAVQGAFDIYPESETSFFLKLDGSQLSFIKNGKGEVTRVIHHSAHPGIPDGRGKKVR